MIPYSHLTLCLCWCTFTAIIFAKTTETDLCPSLYNVPLSKFHTVRIICESYVTYSWINAQTPPASVLIKTYAWALMDTVWKQNRKRYVNGRQGLYQWAIKIKLGSLQVMSLGNGTSWSYWIVCKIVHFRQISMSHVVKCLRFHNKYFKYSCLFQVVLNVNTKLNSNCYKTVSQYLHLFTLFSQVRLYFGFGRLLEWKTHHSSLSIPLVLQLPWQQISVLSNQIFVPMYDTTTSQSSSNIGKYIFWKTGFKYFLCFGWFMIFCL